MADSLRKTCGIVRIALHYNKILEMELRTGEESYCFIGKLIKINKIRRRSHE